MREKWTKRNKECKESRRKKGETERESKSAFREKAEKKKENKAKLRKNKEERRHRNLLKVVRNQRTQAKRWSPMAEIEINMPCVKVISIFINEWKSLQICIRAKRR